MESIIYYDFICTWCRKHQNLFFAFSQHKIRSDLTLRDPHFIYVKYTNSGNIIYRESDFQ